MSNDTVTTPDLFTLNREDLPRTPSRKRTYNINSEITVFRCTQKRGTVEDGFEDVEAEGYFQAAAVRLTRMTVRPQNVKDSRTGQYKRVFVANFSLIADDERIGLVVDGEQVPHPLYHEPRYQGWANARSDISSDNPRPHRIEAQQWVQPENINLLVNFLNFLNSQSNMQVTKNPQRQQGRKTDDLFLVTPRSSIEVRNVRQIGVPIDAFEVSINPNYERGFRSFYDGLEDQRLRIERALAQGEHDERAMYRSFEQMKVNSHYITGAYAETDGSGNLTGSWWPRRADIGIFTINSEEFPLYHSGVEKVDVGDFEELMDAPAVAPAPKIRGQDLAGHLDTGETQETESDEVQDTDEAF